MSKLRDSIENFLSDRPRNTAEILEHINGLMSDGSTASSQKLEFLLSKDKNLVRIGYVKRSGILSGEYDICEWATREWVSQHCPEWVDEVKVNDKKHHLNYTFSDEDNPFFRVP